MKSLSNHSRAGPCPMLNYNVHGILNISSEFDLGIPSVFLTDSYVNPDLTVRLISKLSGSQRSDELVVPLFPLGLRALRVRNLTGNTVVEVCGADRRFVRSSFLPVMALLWLKLLQKNYCLLHSACLAKNGKGIVLAAYGDAGKTTTALRMIRNDAFSYLSDDLTLIDDKGLAYSYPCNARMHAAHLRFLGIKPRLGEICNLIFHDYVLSVLKNVLERASPPIRKNLSQALLMIPVAISAGLKMKIERILSSEELIQKAKISTICFLERGAEEITEVPSELMVEKLTSMNRKEVWSEIEGWLQYFSKVNPSLLPNALVGFEKKLLDSVAARCACYIVRSKQKKFANLIRAIV